MVNPRSAILLVVLLICPWLFLGGPEYFNDRAMRGAWNLGHIPFFAMSCWLFGDFLQRRYRMRGLRLVLLLPLATLVVGLAIELIQRQVGREFSWGDVTFDLVGCALALMCLHSVRAATPSWLVWLIATGLGVLLLWLVKPVVVALCDEYWSREHFPVLADFSTPFEWERFDGSASFEQQVLADDNAVLVVDFGTEQYSNLDLQHFPGDWSGFAVLRFEVGNPGTQPVQLACKIQDRRHDRRGHRFSDRYNTRIDIYPGWQSIRIDLSEVREAPADRTMNMRSITLFSCFTVQAKAPLQLYFDDFRLADD